MLTYSFHKKSFTPSSCSRAWKLALILWRSSLSAHQVLLEGLLKPRLLTPCLRGSDSVTLRWSLIIYISSKLSGHVDAVGLNPTVFMNQWFNKSFIMQLKNHLLQESFLSTYTHITLSILNEYLFASLTCYALTTLHWIIYSRTFAQGSRWKDIPLLKGDTYLDFQGKALNEFPIKVNFVSLPCKSLRTALLLIFIRLLLEPHLLPCSIQLCETEQYQPCSGLVSWKNMFDIY